MNIRLPESGVKRAGFAVGAVIGLLVALLILPVALLAVELVVGTVSAVISIVTEPRKGRRPAGTDLNLRSVGSPR